LIISENIKKIRLLVIFGINKMLKTTGKFSSFKTVNKFESSEEIKINIFTNIFKI
jgi:hypothetical protein